MAKQLRQFYLASPSAAPEDGAALAMGDRSGASGTHSGTPPDAPARVRLSDELKARFTNQPSDGYMSMAAAMTKLRMSRQSVLQKIKRNELQAAFVTSGRGKGLYVKVTSAEPSLFEQAGCNRGAI